ncbi:MAG: hypothetical protein WC227_02075 [Patescibacteria group bacterium]|jgi:hypothetical protein
MDEQIQSQVQAAKPSKKMSIIFYSIAAVLGIAVAYGSYFLVDNIVSMLSHPGFLRVTFVLRILLERFGLYAIVATLIMFFSFRRQIGFFRIFLTLLLSFFVFFGISVGVYSFKNAIDYRADKQKYAEVLGAKAYDFTVKNSLTKTTSAKTKLAIVSGRALWVEHTKEAPKYPENQWDLFEFDFDEAKSTGEVFQLSETTGDKGAGSIESYLATDEGIYWVEDRSLYFQSGDASTKVLVKSLVANILGISGDSMLLEYAAKELDYTTGARGIYLYNKKTGAEKNLSNLKIYGASDDPRYNGGGANNVRYGGAAEATLAKGKIVFVEQAKELRKKINLYDLTSEEITTIIDISNETSAENPYTNGSIRLVSFDGDFVKYDSGDVAIYQLSAGKTILTGAEANGQLVDGKVYKMSLGADSRYINVRDIITKEDSRYSLGAKEELVNWVAGDGFALYMTRTDADGDKIWLKALK